MKKIISSILIISIMLSFFTGITYAYEPYLNDNFVKLKTITFTDNESGQPVERISSGDEIKVETYVKAGQDIPSGQKANLIVSVYDGENMVLLDDSAVITVTETAKPLSAVITIPNGTDLSLKAYLWDSLDNVRPLASAAVYDGNNASVKDIVVDGVSLDAFKNEVKEYSIDVSAAHVNFPEISVLTEDSAAKAEIIITGGLHEEGSYATINVTSANGNIHDSYKINYIWEAPVITNAKYNPVGGESISIKTDTMAEPVWSAGKEPLIKPTELSIFATNSLIRQRFDEGGVDFDKAFLGGNLPSSFTSMFADRTGFYYYDISPELVGGYSLITHYKPADIISNAYTAETDNFITFDINKSATVYVAGGGVTWTQYGFEDLKGPASYMICSYSTYYSCERVDMFKKEYTVKPGETLTVSLPNFKTAGGRIAVKFIDNYTISDSCLSAGENASTQATSLPVGRDNFSPVYSIKDLPNNDYWKNIRYYSRYCYDDINGKTIGVPFFYPDEYYIGGDFLRFPTMLNPTGAYNQAIFKLVSSCKVRFYWNDSTTSSSIITWANANGWTQVSSSDAKILENSSDSATPVNIIENGGICFEKSFNIIPGEYEIVSIPLPFTDKQLYVCAKPADLQ